VTREPAAKHLTARQAITQTAALRVRTLPIWAAAFAAGATILARQTDVSVAALAAFGAASLTIGTHGPRTGDRITDASALRSPLK
jgi:hypothetical protein